MNAITMNSWGYIIAVCLQNCFEMIINSSLFFINHIRDILPEVALIANKVTYDMTYKNKIYYIFHKESIRDAINHEEYDLENFVKSLKWLLLKERNQYGKKYILTVKV